MTATKVHPLSTRMRMLRGPLAAIFLGGLITPASQVEAPSTGLLNSTRAVAINSRTGKVYAVDSARNAVEIFDPVTRATARVAVGEAPVAIAVNEPTNAIYVANSGGDTVSAIDGKTDVLTKEIKVGPRPYVVAANPATNRIYVSNTFSRVITVIDARTNLTTTVEAGSADAIAVDQNLDRVYLLGYEDTHLTVLDQSARVVGKVAAGIHLWGIAVNGSTHTLYATRSGTGELLIFDEDSAQATTLPVGAMPCAVAVNEATNRVYVANHSEDTVTVIDAAKGVRVATLNVGSRPQALAIDPGRNLVYVANTHGDSVTVIDGAQNRVRETVKTGKNPYALAVSPMSGQLYVAVEGSRALEVIDVQYILR
jgi:YVTN family beta-propeller protein